MTQCEPGISQAELSGPDPLRGAAAEILGEQRHLLPNLASVTVVLPSLHAAAPLARSLGEAAGVPALFLPRITTLRDWAATVPLHCETVPDSRRGAMLYGALRERGWFREGDLWHISTELRQLLDELTQYRVRLPARYEEFLAQLEQAYQARAGESLQFEARLVHELWFALASSGGVDHVAAYHLRLARLAQSASGPLYGVGLGELGPAEEAFFQAYGERRAVRLLQPLRGENAGPLGALLAAAWAPVGENMAAADDGADGDARDDPGFLPLRARARRFRERYPASPAQGGFSLFGAHSLEQEAAAVDVRVRQWLLAGKKTIAVVVQDRLAARRARALLERAQVLVEDETGWTFSTAAASTVVMRWLAALASRFYYLDLLDLVKSPFMLTDWPGGRRRQAVFRLEQLVRSRSVVAGLDNYLRLARESEGAEDVLEMLQRLRGAAALFDAKRRPLAAWLAILRRALEGLGVWHGLQQDMAGAQLVQLLSRLGAELEGDGGLFDLGEWRRWLDRQLEEATFRDPAIRSPVVFTHLALSRLRRFEGAIILGGDAAHLPGQGGASAFFKQSVRAQLGLPSFADRLRLLEQDLGDLMAGGAEVLVTWQASKNAEPNLLSPYFERLEAFHRLAYGASLADSEYGAIVDQASVRTHLEAPDLPFDRESARPAPPVPPGLVPTSLSAGGYNSLMACPYQFYARHVLRLNEPDQVQLEIEKRDFGEYAHRILYRFHRRYPRVSGQDRPLLERELRAISEEVFAQAIKINYLSHAWALRWAAIIPSYLAWQEEREAAGWCWLDGEVRAEAPFDVGRERVLTLRGRLDRIDASDAEKGWAVLDYKTQSKARLKGKLNLPGEDVQLPLYAALFERALAGPGGIAAAGGLAEAGFVALDQGATAYVAPPQEIAELAGAVLARLRQLFADLYDGAALPANGTDEACAYCEMRGLCRKDYWD